MSQTLINDLTDRVSALQADASRARTDCDKAERERDRLVLALHAVLVGQGMHPELATQVVREVRDR